MSIERQIRIRINASVERRLIIVFILKPGGTDKNENYLAHLRQDRLVA